MPPQQPDGLLDLFDQLLDFRAHLRLPWAAIPARPDRCSDPPPPMQPNASIARQ
jgi:hypothetical protein